MSDLIASHRVHNFSAGPAVLPLPVFSDVWHNGGMLHLSWATYAGQWYVVEYKNHLDAPAWTPLWTNQASGNTLSFTDATTNSPQRFYRIRAGGSTP